MQTISFLIVLILCSFTIWGQFIRGGAGFLYGGQSVWPGSARAVQQQPQTVGPPGNNQYALFEAEMYVRANRWRVSAHNGLGRVARRYQHPDNNLPPPATLPIAFT